MKLKPKLDKRTKPGRLYDKIVEQLGVPESYDDLLKCICVALAEAPSQGKPKKSNVRYNPDAVLFLDTLLQHAGDSIVTDPFDNNWYRLMEWKMRDMPSLELANMISIGEHLAQGGWKGAKPTVKQILNWLPELVNQSSTTDDYDPRYNV